MKATRRYEQGCDEKRTLMHRLGVVGRTLALLSALGSSAVEAAEHALLIGVSEYPLLNGVRLEGPRNDLRLMQTLLLRLGVPAQRTITLSEDGGPTLWPTRDRILRSLEQLAHQARRGDWVIIYFSGHGSQVPQRRVSGSTYREPDGFDEVFLTRDTRAWDPVRHVVEGAISDDELGQALSRITRRGILVWVIVDTCHAADMLRADTAASTEARPIWRNVPAAALGVPRMAEMTTRRGGRPIGGGGGVPSWVAFYAAQADEPAAEELLQDPKRPGERVRFGVFTHNLYHLGMQWRGSFSDLAVQLLQSYDERPFPTPRFEGRLDRTPGFIGSVPTSSASLPAHVQSRRAEPVGSAP